MKTNLLLYALAAATVGAVLFGLRLPPFEGVPRPAPCPPLIPQDVALPSGVEFFDVGARAEITAERAAGFRSATPSFWEMFRGRGSVEFERGTYDAVATWTGESHAMVLLRRGSDYAWVARRHVRLPGGGE